MNDDRGRLLVWPSLEPDAKPAAPWTGVSVAAGGHSVGEREETLGRIDADSAPGRWGFRFSAATAPGPVPFPRPFRCRRPRRRTNADAASGGYRPAPVWQVCDWSPPTSPAWSELNVVVPFGRWDFGQCRLFMR
jgi:hypothetical protein